MESALITKFDTNQHSFITAAWRPPYHLHLNQATTSTFITGYLLDTIFDFSSLDTSAALALCAPWLNSLPKSCPLKRIHHLRFACSYTAWSPPLDCAALWKALQMISDKEADQIALEDVDPSAYTRLLRILNEEIEALADPRQETRVRRDLREEGGWSYASTRAEMRVQWCGLDEVVHEVWMALGYESAEDTLIRDVQRGCRNKDDGQ
ncbi:hypothetical protein B0A48_04758 [Cryoendolithus antarcticus]|uniref:Uncharacterized protein n=1 Tax=Cryoendolithus antarcticus TaxID=1507870 RepID=A0A1V8TDA2_9PEZI|nr:hypothetical protein B0A48_04758 [Cryoendolithus antarcticus]